MRVHLKFCVATLLLGGLPLGTALAQLKINNNVPGNFIDLSLRVTATRLNPRLTDDEERAIVTTIGNAVFPAGRVVIANNGGLGFGSFPTLPSDDLSPIEQPLPSNDAFGGGQALLPYWDDIGNTIGDIFYEEIFSVSPAQLIVQWHDKRLDEFPGTTVRFQAIVYEDVVAAAALDSAGDGPGDGPSLRLPFSQFIYRDIQQRGACGRSATIGYQDGKRGFNDVQWSFQQSGATGDNGVLSLVRAIGPVCPQWVPYDPSSVAGAIVNCDPNDRVQVTIPNPGIPSGVALSTAGVQALRTDWLYIEPPWLTPTIPVGAVLELRAFGDRIGMGIGSLGSVRCTKTAPNTYTIVPNFTTLGTVTYRVRAYLNGVLINSLDGRTGTAAVAPRWPESGESGRFGAAPDYTLRWCSPTTITLIGVGTTTIDELRLISQGGVGSTFVNQLQVLTEDIRNFTLVRAGRTPLVTPGDLNCDGMVDFNDISGFVTALVSREAYALEYPDCNYDNADTDRDGDVDFDDIQSFVICLVEGGCS